MAKSVVSDNCVVVYVCVTLDSIDAIDQTNQRFGAALWVTLTTPIPYQEKKKEKVKELLTSFMSQESSNSQAWITARNRVDSDAVGFATIYFDETEDGRNFRLSWSLIGKFGEAFELQDFPFDSQDFTVSMNIRYPNKGLKMVLVTSDNSRIMPKALSLVQHAWRNPKMHLWEEVVPNRNATAVSRHVLNATLSMNRVPNYYFSNVILPICIITTLSASSFFIPPYDVSSRLSTTLTLVLTAVAYKYVVAQMVPPIGYDTVLDRYVMLCFIFLSFVVAENCLAFQFQHISEREVMIGCALFGSFWMFNLRIGLLFLKAAGRGTHSRLSRKFDQRNRDDLEDGTDYHQIAKLSDDEDAFSREGTSQYAESSE